MRAVVRLDVDEAHDAILIDDEHGGSGQADCALGVDLRQVETEVALSGEDVVSLLEGRCRSDRPGRLPGSRGRSFSLSGSGCDGPGGRAAIPASTVVLRGLRKVLVDESAQYLATNDVERRESGGGVLAGHWYAKVEALVRALAGAERGLRSA